MKIEKGKIYAFKMTSGQEIVGKILDIDDEIYYLDRPLTIGQGPKGMELLPVMFTGKHLSNSCMYRHAIALASPIRDDVQKVYEESIDPDAVKIITLVKKQIITG